MPLNSSLSIARSCRADNYEWSTEKLAHKRADDDLDLERENRLLSEALSKETHLREKAEGTCLELQRKLQRVSDSEKNLKLKLERVAQEYEVENKLEIIRLDHLVAQLSAQIESQEELLRDTEARESEYEKMTLANMDRLQAEWIKVLSDNHVRQKESQSRIEELEAQLRQSERAETAQDESLASARQQLAEARAQCARLQEEVERARQAADAWRARHEAADRRAGAGHEAQEVCGGGSRLRQSANSRSYPSR